MRKNIFCKFLSEKSAIESMEKSVKQIRDEKYSVLSSVKAFLYDLYNRGIPSDEVQSMHESWRIPVAAVIYSSFIAIFIAFLVTGTQHYL